MGTIIKRGDSYRAVIRKAGHKTVTKTFSKKALAKTWITATEAAMERQELTTAHVRISDLIDRYLAEIEPLKPTQEQSRKNYRALSRVTKSLTLESLNATDLLQWAQDHRRGVARATLAMDLTMITSVLKTAEAFWKVIVPWNSFKIARTALGRLGLVGKSQERERRPEGEEMDQIKAAIRSELPVAMLIDFAIATTMRSAEVTRLKWKDLNPAKRTIIIRDRKHPREKIGNDQEVPLLNGAWEIANAQPRLPDEDRIFPFLSKSIESAFQRACRAAGVADLRYHDLRHHGISLLFEQGYAIQEVAMVSGHRDWNQLRRYVNLKPESLHQGPVALRILRDPGKEKPAEAG